jgi:alpha-tubulin suppressor-like RCC1 family protein
MRATVLRSCGFVVVGLLVVGCSAAPTPSPLPSGTGASAAPTPSQTTILPTASPTPGVPLLAAIGAGRDHTCAVLVDGRLRCWGANGSGQLGDATTTDSHIPRVVIGLPDGITAVAAGAFHTCALTGGGAVWCWGSTMDGAGGTTGAAVVPGLEGGVRAIVAGEQHTCALAGGVVKCWGANYTGQLGTDGPDISHAPLDVAGLGDGVVAIAAGDGHSCAITSAGGVKCWGSGWDGELGNGTRVATSAPVDVADLDAGAVAISAGGRHTCALMRDETIRCWGAIWYGGLNGSNVTGSDVPETVAGLDGRAVGIAAGAGHACALMVAGPVRCWGNGEFGQLGTGSTNGSRSAVDAPDLAGALALAAGANHTCAATSAGGLTCVGDNWFGQLGTVTRCTSTSAAVAVRFDGTTPDPVIPTGPPVGPIAHPTGPTDVVLRFDNGPDVAVSDLTGELFRPGPEFTLYGDGTVIFRDESVAPPPSVGAIIRGWPFQTTRLDAARIQTFLEFALGEGGLWDACDRYEARNDVDGFITAEFAFNAAGVDRRIVGLEGQFADYLRDFADQTGAPSAPFVGDRFWGNLLDTTHFLEGGLLPDPAEAGTLPWPWPDLAPSDFPGLDEVVAGSRVMTEQEAVAAGLSHDGGVVQRVYLVSPDGAKTYSFSLWPVLPDEPD